MAEQSGKTNFDVDAFVRSNDALYIAADTEWQEMSAPLIVALIDAIRQAAYRYRREEKRRTDSNPRRLLMAIDEVANVASLPTLPEVGFVAGTTSGETRFVDEDGKLQ